MPATFRPTDLPHVTVCEVQSHPDRRGRFMELYHREEYACGGVGATFVQDNFSYSKRGVLRGMHYQLRQPQAKLVTCLFGEVFDVAVDLRTGSPSFGSWFGTVLSADNHRQLFIPEGFAHGFCVLSEGAGIVYKCSAFYRPDDDHGLRWDDPRVGIQWPRRDPVVSDRDSALPLLDKIPESGLPRFDTASQS